MAGSPSTVPAPPDARCLPRRRARRAPSASEGGRCPTVQRTARRRQQVRSSRSLRLVAGDGGGTVAAAGGLLMPSSVLVFVLDDLGPAGDPLFGGGAPGGGNGLRMRGEG